MTLEEVLATAARAPRRRRATASAWARPGARCATAPQFDAVLDMVRGVRALGMEACVTLGMLTDEQARALAEAGLTAYNHNLDTVARILSQDHHDAHLRRPARDACRRCATPASTSAAAASSAWARASPIAPRMLQVLATFDPHPESVPINALVADRGTPLATATRVDPLDFVRMIATARIVLPASRVRLSAGPR